MNTDPATDDAKIGALYEFFAAGASIGEKFIPIDQSVATKGWTQITDGLLIPDGANPDEIYVTLKMGKDAMGTVWFDDIGCGTDPWTMGLFNGNAEIPLGWMEWHAGGENMNYSNLDSAEAHSGDWSALLRERDDEGDEMVFYSEPVPAVPGEWYMVSVWTKWDSINTDPSYLPSNVTPDRDDDRLGMCFFFHRLDLRDEWELTGGDQFFYFDQRDSAGGWIQYCVKAKAPDDAVGVSCRARLTSFPKGYVWYDDFAISHITFVETGISEWELDETVRPEKFKLMQNYPNPFNPSTQIGYTLISAGPTKLEVYNMMGQRIRTLVDEERPAGSYRVMWDGRDDSGNRVVSGVYFYRLQTAKSVVTKRMILVK